jgi:hypothetical protein
MVFIRRDLGTQAIEKFPAQTGITRFGEPGEIADTSCHLQRSGRQEASVRMDGSEMKGI